MEILGVAQFYVGLLFALASVILVIFSDLSLLVTIILLILGIVLVANSKYGPMK